MRHFIYTNHDLMRKMWQSLDVVFMGKSAWKAAKEEVKSIIHEPVWEQARTFQDVHGQYIRQSASSHRIPHQLLAAIIFTEMTYDPHPLWLDDYVSLARLAIEKSTSVGPGQMNVSHLQRWGFEGSKWELGWRLHTDVHFAIDASARLLNELVIEYRKRQIKDIELEVTRMIRGRSYSPPGWKSYEPKTLSYVRTQNIERDAWPTIAQWYNGGPGATTNIKYRRKFEESLRALR